MLWVEFVSACDGGLVDPVAGDGLGEQIEAGLVVSGDYVGVVGFWGIPFRKVHDLAEC